MILVVFPLSSDVIGCENLCMDWVVHDTIPIVMSIAVELVKFAGFVQ